MSFKKMILAEDVKSNPSAFITTIAAPQRSNANHISQLDNQMSDIMTQTIGDDIKLKLYSDTLSRYLKANENLTNPKVKKDVETKKYDKDISTIIGGIPKVYQRRATQLLEIINRDNSPLSYDANGGVSYHGTAIPNSHIIDMINYSTNSASKQKPQNFDTFLKGLKELHTPQLFLSKHIRETPNDYDVMSPARMIQSSPMPLRNTRRTIFDRWET